MNPLFQLSTRSYEKEIPIVRQALADLETECNIHNGYKIGDSFEKFGWTFFNIQISEELTKIIEESGMMKGALGRKIEEQMTNFMGHYLETKGSKVRIKMINYG
ncbi:hypothetical protein [Candidatus Nitrosopumilus sediminis]|uniref:Uncharacterized protein n=1 Tax=Candidatus Nitrosopumilus sediminis TaxID=1229909 RepID=K0BBE7_9ARCH|nr:hypothetical protein [Candidatus Nitrosopumilus sediminis]AFS83558.1 hypothetical protein NSED_08840 [Candidatus Nitrosopumilus sediminis]